MNIVYTKHAKDKLKEKESKKFGINKIKLERIIKNPNSMQDLVFVKRAVGKLNARHSLCVVYKLIEDRIIKVITFFPAEVGRYES